MPQPVSIIAVRIPQGNLVEPLPQLLAAVMLHVAWIARIREQRRQALAQSQPLIHWAQQHRSAITGNVGRVKSDGNRVGRMEVQRQLCNTLCQRLAPLPLVRKS